jgi:hypothetical protein
MDHCFYHLTNLPLLPRLYTKLAANETYMVPGAHKQEARSVFTDCPTFLKSPIGIELAKHFTLKANLIRFDPKSFYDWHCDAGHQGNAPRQCAINYVLSDNLGALTVYKIEELYAINYKIAVCDYTVLQPTLFNTQIPHCVCNPTDSYRYLLSVSLMDVSYEQALDKLKGRSIDI